MELAQKPRQFDKIEPGKNFLFEMSTNKLWMYCLNCIICHWMTSVYYQYSNWRNKNEQSHIYIKCKPKVNRSFVFVCFWIKFGEKCLFECDFAFQYCSHTI